MFMLLCAYYVVMICCSHRRQKHQNKALFSFAWPSRYVVMSQVWTRLKPGSHLKVSSSALVVNMTAKQVISRHGKIENECDMYKNRKRTWIAWKTPVKSSSCLSPPHNWKAGRFTSLIAREPMRNVQKWKTHVQCVYSYWFLLYNCTS